MVYSNTTSNNSGSVSFLSFLPHYDGLEWRLDVITATRATPIITAAGLTPIITMRLKLKHNDDVSVSSGHQDDEEKSASENTNHKNDVFLQTDPVNLCHMIDVLENALREARSQQVRKLKRQV